jgi:hypothetical protein
MKLLVIKPPLLLIIPLHYVQFSAHYPGFQTHQFTYVACEVPTAVILGYNIVYSVESHTTFRRNMSLQFSGWKNKPSKNQSEGRCKVERLFNFNELLGVIRRKTELFNLYTVFTPHKIFL